MFRCLFLCALLLPALSAQGADPRPKSGIPEIDSLPLNDWSVSTTPLSTPKTLLLSTLFPGGGQFYGGHPVRGGFLLGLESTLFGLSLYTYFVTLPQYDRETRHFLSAADTAFKQRNPAYFQSLVQAARDNGSKRIQEAELANSELAWAIGLHFYGMADAVEIARRSQGIVPPVRSVQSAMWYGLAFPGGGQLYTANYGKFGMLWMALGSQRAFGLVAPECR